ncbi:MAG: transcriptional repressor [Tissierellia bacterium]|nr:transcriptional repressor [Tissierellia bacterium]
MAKKYYTRHRKDLLEYLQAHADLDYTVAKLHKAMKEEGYTMGIATLYRQINSLFKEGYLTPIQRDDGAEQFQYLKNPRECFVHYHLKCKVCGRLYHLDCTFMEDLEEHVKKEHGFLIDRSDSMLYGRCSDCVGKEDK